MSGFPKVNRAFKLLFVIAVDGAENFGSHAFEATFRIRLQQMNEMSAFA